jgi:histidine ammonia-lyase
MAGGRLLGCPARRLGGGVSELGHSSGTIAAADPVRGAAVVLRPGRASLADWRAIYRGAGVTLDPIARADVEAGAAGLEAIRAKGGAVPSDDRDAPAPQEDDRERRETLPGTIARLAVALKLASLGQGATGTRWTVVRTLADCLAADILPELAEPPAADGEALVPLVHLLRGSGEARRGATGMAATEALAAARLAAVEPDADERRALVSGAAVETAFALAGLFEAERVLQAGIVALALSQACAGERPSGLHRTARRLHRHPGKGEVAAAFTALWGDVASNREAPDSAWSERLKLGGCLDLLALAGALLARQANAVTEERLVLWQSDEIVAGLADRSSLQTAADMISLALCEQSRLAMARLDGEGCSADVPPSARAMASSFFGELGERAVPAGLRTNGKDRGGGVRQLLPLAGTAALIVAIAAATAARGLDRRSAEPLDAPLDGARRLIRERAPPSDASGAFGLADLAAAAELVRSGALAAAAGVPLPTIADPVAPARRARLGVRRKGP